MYEPQFTFRLEVKMSMNYKKLDIKAFFITIYGSHFSYRIKKNKKAIVTIYLTITILYVTILTLFLTILSLHLAILTFLFPPQNKTVKKATWTIFLALMCLNVVILTFQNSSSHSSETHNFQKKCQNCAMSTTVEYPISVFYVRGWVYWALGQCEQR